VVLLLRKMHSHITIQSLDHGILITGMIGKITGQLMQNKMKKLTYFLLAINLILILHSIVFFEVSSWEESSVFIQMDWKIYMLDYGYQAIFFGFLLSLLTPFFNVKLWLKISSPLVSGLHLGYMIFRFDYFQFG